jgi:hypothetical protein
MTMETPPGRLARLQEEFAGHIRDPDRQEPPPDVENRRMHIYRRLFFNNIDSLLSSNFPVLRSIYDDADWRGLVRDFYAEHRCQTPLFPEVAKEFLRYLQDHRGIRDGDPPFMLELAHYEWVELALTIDEREHSDVPADPAGDLLDGCPVLSPLAWPLSYRFPVHRIGKSFQPTEAPDDPTHLLVYRNREDEVRFMTLNDVTRLLIDVLGDESAATGRASLLRVARDIGHPRPERVVEAGAAVMQDLLERDVLLGARIE